MNPQLHCDCPKHGPHVRALPVVDGALRPHREWPKDITDESKYRRVCMKCIAEAMVQPIRRRAA